MSIWRYNARSHGEKRADAYDRFLKKAILGLPGS